MSWPMSEHRTISQLLSDCGLTIDLDITRFRDEPSRAERRLLKMLDGPVLDVGCGPGRAAAFLRDHGVAALGLDISAALVDLARKNGALCVHQSIFDTVPFEGRWHEVLLLDGNIGIGGDPTKMLERLARIVRPNGRAFIEVASSGPTRQVVVREHRGGKTGEPFAWAVVSIDGIDDLLAGTGWVCRHLHTIHDRRPGERWRPSDRQHGVDDRLVVELELIS